MQPKRRPKSAAPAARILEYVIVHEMAHVVVPTHSSKFIDLLDAHYPFWREARRELNDLPLSSAS